MFILYDMGLIKGCINQIMQNFILKDINLYKWLILQWGNNSID